MIKEFCDKCKKELPIKTKHWFSVEPKPYLLIHINTFPQKVSLCTSCWENMLKYLELKKK